MFDSIEIISLLNKSFDSDSFIEFCKRHGINRELELVSDTLYCFTPKMGFDFLFNEEHIITTLFFYGDPEESEDNSVFAGRLPYNLSFPMNRTEVRRMLGVPEKLYDGGVILNMKVTPWDRFLTKEYFLHIQYSSDSSHIKLVTISLEDPTLVV